MNRFTVRYKDENAVKLLDKYGEITYKSSMISILFINTQYSKEELLEVEGVLKVEEVRIGKLC